MSSNNNARETRPPWFMMMFAVDEARTNAEDHSDDSRDITDPREVRNMVDYQPNETYDCPDESRAISEYYYFATRVMTYDVFNEARAIVDFRNYEERAMADYYHYLASATEVDHLNEARATAGYHSHAATAMAVDHPHYAGAMADVHPIEDVNESESTIYADSSTSNEDFGKILSQYFSSSLNCF